MIVNQTPPTNRGVENTTKTALTAVVDWLQVTLNFTKHNLLLNWLCDYVNLDVSDFFIGTGGYFYEDSLTNNKGVTIYYNGLNDNMGVHLQLSGKGCRFIEKNKEGFSWRDLLISLHDTFDHLNINYSRIDIAIDDFKTYFTVDELINKLERQEIISPLRSSHYIKSLNISNGVSNGSTLYLGQSNGIVQIRFYEKYKELQAKGYNMKGKPKNWNRYEIQLRSDRANKVANLIRNKNDLMPIVKGILKRYVSIRTKKRNEKNRSRWGLWYKWRDFLKDVEDINLSISIDELDLEKKINWVDRQVKKTLAMINEADPAILNKIINAGLEKLDMKDLKQIKEYKKSANNSAND